MSVRKKRNVSVSPKSTQINHNGEKMKLSQLPAGSAFQTLNNYHTGRIPIPAGTRCQLPNHLPLTTTAMLAVTVNDSHFPHGNITFAIDKTSEVCSEEELATLF
ncbi:MAG: hypothetical protein ABII21_00985 [bacterium]